MLAYDVIHNVDQCAEAFLCVDYYPDQEVILLLRPTSCTYHDDVHAFVAG